MKGAATVILSAGPTRQSKLCGAVISEELLLMKKRLIAFGGIAALLMAIAPAFAQGQRGIERRAVRMATPT